MVEMGDVVVVTVGDGDDGGGDDSAIGEGDG